MRGRGYGRSVGCVDTNHGGEVRRYLRFIRLETNARKIGQLVAQAKYHARAAWHMATKREAAR
jgi:hypothetical protein